MKHVFFIVLPLAGFFWLLANGIYAMLRPAAWLRAKWTLTRGVEPGKPLLPGDEMGIRWGWGPLWLAMSVFWGWVALSEFSK